MLRSDPWLRAFAPNPAFRIPHPAPTPRFSLRTDLDLEYAYCLHVAPPTFAPLQLLCLSPRLRTASQHIGRSAFLQLTSSYGCGKCSMAATSSPLSHLPPAVSAAPFSRRDGRSTSQLRPLSYELSLLHRADGSVRFTQGNTTLIVAVYGPTLATAREERWDAAVLSFTFSTLSAAASSSWLLTASSPLSHQLQATFAPIVLTALHPRQRISVHVQLVHDDGGAAGLRGQRRHARAAGRRRAVQGDDRSSGAEGQEGADAAQQGDARPGPQQRGGAGHRRSTRREEQVAEQRAADRLLLPPPCPLRRASLMASPSLSPIDVSSVHAASALHQSLAAVLLIHVSATVFLRFSQRCGAVGLRRLHR